MLTFDGKYFYNNKHMFSSDIVYTYRNHRVYKGKSEYSSDIVLTIDNDSRKVYKGRNKYSSNVIMRYQGSIPTHVIVFVALNLLNK
jgi:hypothetical protein